jgi:GDP-L-fucose synthase
MSLNESAKFKKVLVTGGTGMIGNALRHLAPNAIFLSSKDADLRKAHETQDILNFYKPDAVIHLAARVGGIKANMDYLGDFYYDNIMINTNVIHSCKKTSVKKLISVLSTCVYPDNASYPLTEEQMHSGPPHKSNYAYAHVKRMIDVQSRAYRDQFGCNFTTVIPNNLFGKHDNFDLKNSHVIPAIIRKIYEARNKKENVVLWGDGSPLREFTYADDMASILLFLLDNFECREPINVGNTIQYSIKQLAEMIADIYNFEGEIVWDTSGPPGQYKKPSDNSKLIDLGWKKENYTNFQSALEEVCKWFENNYKEARGVFI